jgi:hypothetical protein
MNEQARDTLAALAAEMTDPRVLRAIRRLHKILGLPIAANAVSPEWDDVEDARLRGLWLSGLSASKIAAQMPGRTRNAIIGRAHRLKLPNRPSPLRTFA